MSPWKDCFLVWLDERGEEQHMEVLAAGQQFVAYSYHPDTGLPYTWYRDGKPSGLTRIARADLPQLSRAAALYWVRRFDEIAASRCWCLVRKQDVEARPVERHEQAARAPYGFRPRSRDGSRRNSGAGRLPSVDPRRHVIMSSDPGI